MLAPRHRFVAAAFVASVAVTLALAGCSAGVSPPPPGARPDGGSPPVEEPDLAAPLDPPDAGARSDAGPPRSDGGATGLLLPATVTCAPSGGSVCGLAAASPSTITAQLRKDAWLTTYSENTPEPRDGGRVQLAAISAVTGNVTRVLVDGVDLDGLDAPNPATTPPFEWGHVWPRAVRAGEPVWVAFHSRAATWNTRTSAPIVVETDAGMAVSGTFTIERARVVVTWVTTSTDGKTLLVHLQNREPATRTIARLLVDGRDVTAHACLPSRTLAAGASTLITVPSCAPRAPGSAFTVVIEHDAGAAVAVGRTQRPFFPVEAWNNTTECPFPGAGGNATNDAALVAAGIDTTYLHGGVCGTCGCDAYDLVNTTLPPTGRKVLVTDDLGTGLFATRPLTDTRALAGFATGDESDGSIYDEATKAPVAATKARRARTLWARYPEIPVFNGAKTNRNIGTFAGMTDVQGIDLYVAACAPHITPFGQHPPLRGAYDYLRNARENMMPLPTWLYAQGLSPAWNKQRPIVGGTIHVQPDPQEILVQGMSVVAAGGKGLLWFQANQDEAKHAPARWAAIGDVSWMVRGVRELLREGDPTGAARAIGGDAIVEAVRARGAIVVPVIGLETTAAPTDLACAGALVDESQVPRWVVAAKTLTVEIDVPPDLAIADAFEVLPGRVAAPPSPPQITGGRTLRLANIAVDNARPARLFVLAATPTLRAEIAALLRR
jgi:hypothetical protein